MSADDGWVTADTTSIRGHWSTVWVDGNGVAHFCFDSLRATGSKVEYGGEIIAVTVGSGIAFSYTYLHRLDGRVGAPRASHQAEFERDITRYIESWD